MQTTLHEKHPASTSFEEHVIEMFRSKRFAALSLQDSLLDTEEPSLLGITLQRIILANGGFTRVSKLTGIGREALYRAVSLKSTPKIQTVYKILSALDIPFSFPRPKKRTGHAKRIGDKKAKRLTNKSGKRQVSKEH